MRKRCQESFNDDFAFFPLAESKNVAAQHPDIVKRLSAKVEAWVATLTKEYVKADDPDK